jgi:hypothetical protein
MYLNMSLRALMMAIFELTDLGISAKVARIDFIDIYIISCQLYFLFLVLTQGLILLILI